MELVSYSTASDMKQAFKQWKTMCSLLHEQVILYMIKIWFTNLVPQALPEMSYHGACVTVNNVAATTPIIVPTAGPNPVKPTFLKCSGQE